MRPNKFKKVVKAKMETPLLEEKEKEENKYGELNTKLLKHIEALDQKEMKAREAVVIAIKKAMEEMFQSDGDNIKIWPWWDTGLSGNTWDHNWDSYLEQAGIDSKLVKKKEYWKWCVKIYF